MAEAGIHSEIVGDNARLTVIARDRQVSVELDRHELHGFISHLMTIYRRLDAARLAGAAEEAKREAEAKRERKQAKRMPDVHH